MLDPTSPSDLEEARRLTDVYRRPFYEQPFLITEDLEVTDNYIRVKFFYGSGKPRSGYAWVHRVTEQVTSTQPDPL